MLPSYNNTGSSDYFMFVTCRYICSQNVQVVVSDRGGGTCPFFFSVYWLFSAYLKYQITSCLLTQIWWCSFNCHCIFENLFSKYSDSIYELGPLGNLCFSSLSTRYLVSASSMGRSDYFMFVRSDMMMQFYCNCILTRGRKSNPQRCTCME